jgi:hypothetical protein
VPLGGDAALCCDAPFGDEALGCDATLGGDATLGAALSIGIALLTEPILITEGLSCNTLTFIILYISVYYTGFLLFFI